MNDIYLKASDALELYAYLESAGVTVRGEDGPVVSDAHKFALDVIGTIYKPTGKVVQMQTEEVQEMAAIDGYHANLRVLAANFDAAPLAAITIEPPDSPVRGWA
jgi:hypothetical protein